MKMNKSIISVFAALLAMTSCSDWIKPENLDYSRKTERNLAAIRAYKETDHNLMFVTLNGTDRLEYSHQHPMNLPDSTDVIILRLSGGLHPTVADEIKEVWKTKRTRSYLLVDFAAIEAEWKALESAREDAGQEPGTTEEAIAFFREKTSVQLAAYDKYEFRGIVVSFEGNTSGMRGDMQTAFLGTFIEWRAGHKDVKFILRGTIRNIDYEKNEYSTLINDSEYLAVVTTESSTSIGEINKQVSRILTYIPVEQRRVLFEINVPDLEEKKQVGASPATAADWLVKEKDNIAFKPFGIVVSNVQDDYYNGSENVFKLTRACISLMNPAGGVVETAE